MLTPLFGFSAITAPEITAQTQDITEGNWFFKRKVIRGGDASNITLQRGIAFYDSDFWRWMMASLSGNLSNFGFPLPGGLNVSVGGITPRRTLMLVHFLPRLPGALPAGSDIVIQAGLEAAGTALAGGSALDAAVGGVRTAAFATLGHFAGPFEFAIRLPAKAWLLKGCIPVRYKAASDFSGSDHAISLQELELAIESIDEVALAG